MSADTPYQTAGASTKPNGRYASRTYRLSASSLMDKRDRRQAEVSCHGGSPRCQSLALCLTSQAVSLVRSASPDRIRWILTAALDPPPMSMLDDKGVIRGSDRRSAGDKWARQHAAGLLPGEDSIHNVPSTRDGLT